MQSIGKREKALKPTPDKAFSFVVRGGIEPPTQGFSGIELTLKLF